MFPCTFGFSRFVAGLIVISVIRRAAANCYLPNGTDRNLGFPSDTYFPINPGDDFSMCCSHLGDQPRDDGLCRNSDGTVIWRESCTDRTWQSPKCIKLCADSSPDTNNSPGIGRQMDNDEQVTPCENGSYCCGDGTLGSTCCNEGRGVFVRDGTTQAANPTSTSTSSTSSPSITSSPTANPATSDSNSTTSSSPHKSGSNAGAIAGGVVGGLAGLAIIVVGAWFLLNRRRKGRQRTRG